MSHADVGTTVPVAAPWHRHLRWAARATVEVTLVLGLLAAYRAGRLIGPVREVDARDHAELVRHTERLLHLPSELRLQEAASTVPHVYPLADRYYATVHFPLMAAFLLWGFLARPRREYVWARNLLIVQTFLALAIHLAFPLAPPRMFPQWGFVDTMAVYGPQVYTSSNASVTNQFAAMPSLHIGWAVLIAVVLMRTAPRPVAGLALLHAAVTVVVVVITANHWLLDGIVAVALLGIALLVVPDPSGRRSWRTHPAGRAGRLRSGGPPRS